jgi:hypothetical protein
MLQFVAGRAWTRIVAGTVIAGSVFGACSPFGQAPSTHGPTAAPGGISRDAAITRAREVAPASSPAPTVVWASIESSPFVPRGNAPPGPLVWIVRLQGGLAASPCPSGFLDVPPSASSSACLDGDGGLDVVLDYFSGTSSAGLTDPQADTARSPSSTWGLTGITSALS